MYRGCQKMYTHQMVPKKCIHILRDVIYVKCVYIFLAPSVCIYIYMCVCVQRVSKNVYTSEGAKKMYTHFKRCYLCKMCIHFFGTLCIYTYIYVQRAPKNVYTSEGAKKCIHILRDVIFVNCIHIRGCQKCIHILRDVIYVNCIHIRG